jgi:hypothetical protein
MEARHDGPGGHYQELQALDAVSGKLLWSQRWEHEEAGGFGIDPTGKLVVVGPRDQGGQKPTLREALTGKVMRTLDHWPGSPAPDGKTFIQKLPEHPGISLRNGDHRIFLSLDIDQTIDTSPLFIPDGKHVAWGNADGSVMVADLDEIQARLAQAGLSW